MQRLTGSSNIRQLRDETRCTRPLAAPVPATRSSHLEAPRSYSRLGADRKPLQGRLPRKPLPLRRKVTPSRQNAGVMGRDRYLAICESSCSAPNANQRYCDLDLFELYESYGASGSIGRERGGKDNRSTWLTSHMAKTEPSGTKAIIASWPPKTRVLPDDSRHRRRNLPDLCHLLQNVAGKASSPRLPSRRPEFDS